MEAVVDSLCNTGTCVCPADDADRRREPHRVDGSPDQVRLAMQRHPAALR